MTASTRRRFLAGGAEGATTIEHVLVIATVVLVALGGFALLGDASASKVRCAARALAGDATPCGSSEAAFATLDAPSRAGSASATRAALTRGEERGASGPSDAMRVAAFEGALTGSTNGTAREADGGPRAHVDTACGRWNVVCRASHTVRDVAQASGASRALERAGPLVQRIDWLANPLPPLDPRDLRDWASFRYHAAIGFGRAAVGTATATVALAKWTFTPLIRRIGALFRGDLRTFANPYREEDGIDFGGVWRAIRGVPGALWHALDTCATGPSAEAGLACGALAFDGATMLVPGAGAFKPARYGRAGFRANGVARATVRRGHAFGMRNNPIQYAWEFEGMADEILLYYRPAHVSDAEWRSLSLTERNARSAERAWEEHVRTDDAPTFLRDRLETADDGVWETKVRGYVGTTDELFEQARFVDRNLNRGGGFHFHVTFRPARAHADEVVDFFAQANEYVALRFFARDPANVHHRFLGPASSRTFERIRRGLRDGSSEGQKLSSVGFRITPYGRGRVGYEIRGISLDLDASSRVVEVTTRFLEDPTNAVIRLGEHGRGYRIGEVAGVDRIGVHVLDRLSPDARQFLTEAAELAPYGIAKSRPLLERWTLPLVRWEERSYFPPEVREKVVSFRQQYVHVIEQMARSPHRPGPGEVQFALQSMISEWARELRLHEYY